MIEIFNYPWVRLLIILILVVITSELLAKLVIRLFKRFAKLTRTTRDDELIVKVEKPFVILVALFTLRFGLVSLGFWQDKVILWNNIIDTIIIIFLARIIILVASLAFELWSDNIHRLKKIYLDEQILNAVKKSIGFVIYVIAFGYVLSVWEIDIWPVMGSLGVAGIAFAFALQETLKNLFGGIQLILDKNFKKGDIIELSSGTSGKIHEITLRSTRIKTWDNKLVIIPNGVMANDVITNITQPDKSRRVTVMFGVDYGSDPDYVKKICLQEIKTVKSVEKENPAPRVIFKSMGDSALIFQANYWVKDLNNYIDAREDGTTKIYERLNNAGIGIPFPQMTVWHNDVGKTKVKPYTKVKKTIKKK